MERRIMRVLLTAGLVSAGVAFTAGSAQAQAPAPAAPQVVTPAEAGIAGAKIGYVFVSQLASQSSHGKASQARIEALQAKKQQELQEKQKALLALQQKLTAAASAAPDPARDQMARDADRLNRDLERETQDARDELTALSRDLQLDFEKRLLPVVAQVAAEKGLHLVLSLETEGLLWHEARLDITADVMRRLDAAGAAPAPTAKP